jgi:hypothetical protein
MYLKQVKHQRFMKYTKKSFCLEMSKPEDNLETVRRLITAIQGHNAHIDRMPVGGNSACPGLRSWGLDAPTFELPCAHINAASLPR